MNWLQLRALLWLRWRLTYNQWRRGGAIGAVLMLLVLVGCLALSVVGGIAGLLGGAMGLSAAPPLATMVVWDALVAAFLFFWTMGVVTELQRSELIDMSRLLHLPMALRDVFLLNYIASHLSFSLALLLPGMLGLTLGLAFGRGPAMLLLLPLVFGFFFMITAWTYCLRGWLAALMVNKRRRRAIVIGITTVFILLAQLPNLVTNVWMRGPHGRLSHAIEEQVERNEHERERLIDVAYVVHGCVPILWLPQGARALAEGRVWPAVWGALGMIAIGSWGLVRAYRGTLRFYQGGDNKTPARAPAAVQAINTGNRLLVERTLPAIPEEAAATAMASLRSMLRRRR